MKREEAIKILKHCGTENYCHHYIRTENCYGCNRRVALDMAIEALSKDKTNKPRGEWINRENCQVDEDTYEVATCSNCKSEVTIEYPHDNFCPNCGADMRDNKNENRD